MNVLYDLLICIKVITSSVIALSSFDCILAFYKLGQLDQKRSKLLKFI
jgi:hypothetical protein